MKINNLTNIENIKTVAEFAGKKIVDVDQMNLFGYDIIRVMIEDQHSTLGKKNYDPSVDYNELMDVMNKLSFKGYIYHITPDNTWYEFKETIIASGNTPWEATYKLINRLNKQKKQVEHESRIEY